MKERELNKIIIEETGDLSYAKIRGEFFYDFKFDCFALRFILQVDGIQSCLSYHEYMHEINKKEVKKHLKNAFKSFNNTILNDVHNYQRYIEDNSL